MASPRQLAESKYLFLPLMSNAPNVERFAAVQLWIPPDGVSGLLFRKSKSASGLIPVGVSVRREADLGSPEADLGSPEAAFVWRL